MSQPEEVPQAREGLDEPFGLAPIEYPYRCPVCGAELLVNEAIIDVGIGMAKFQKRSTIPGLCPRWDVLDVMGIQWSTSSQMNSPPEGR
jgi:hypothetical protein